MQRERGVDRPLGSAFERLDDAEHRLEVRSIFRKGVVGREQPPHKWCFVQREMVRTRDLAQKNRERRRFGARRVAAVTHSPRFSADTLGKFTGA